MPNNRLNFGPKHFKVAQGIKDKNLQVCDLKVLADLIYAGYVGLTEKGVNVLDTWNAADSRMEREDGKS